MMKKIEENEISIIKADETFAQAICKVLIKSITDICKADHCDEPNKLYAWLNNKTPENVHQWIKNPSNYTVIALNPKKEVIGVSMITRDGEILLNYLFPNYLGKGIGKRMLMEMEEFAKTNDLKKITVHSTITAQPFYTRNGFQKEVNSKNEDDDNLTLTKILID